MMSRFYLLCICLGTFIGCSNDDDVNIVDGDPVFYTRFEVNGNSYELEAGNYPIYMKTDTRRDENGVYSFVGEFSDFNCFDQDCSGAVRFIFRDDSVIEQGRSNINESLRPGVLPFYTPYDSLLSAVEVTFESSTSKTAGTYDLLWDFGNGETGVVDEPSTQYTSQQGEVTVLCQTTDRDSLTVTSNRLTADFTVDCGVDFTYQFSTGQISALNTQTRGAGPFTFEWDFGHGFMPLSDQPPLDFSGRDSIYACLRAQSATGCTSTRCKTLLVNQNYDIAVTDFDFDTRRIYDVNLEHFSEFTLEYVNEAGQRYSSRRGEQPESSFIRIVDVVDYKENAENIPTKKVTVEFELRVFGSEPEDYLTLESGTAVVAVGHP